MVFRDKIKDSRDPIVMANNNLIRLSTNEALAVHLYRNPKGPTYEEMMEKKFEDINTYEDVQNMALNMLVNGKEFHMGQQN